MALVWDEDRRCSRLGSSYQNGLGERERFVASHQKPGLNFTDWSCPWTLLQDST